MGAHAGCCHESYSIPWNKSLSAAVVSADLGDTRKAYQNHETRWSNVQIPCLFSQYSLSFFLPPSLSLSLSFEILVSVAIVHS